ncbi:recombinase family protein [Paenibacillus sp. MZ04-78.2]|uniref:recombinase family protein n=1 Tax=Paenibacillus sp. MZ04-78.2 TaxID=2962034 RepID=UPI0020B8CA03|nr:recombinase family protein [Paenibacillus sp. MZ04-78.2]MCP3775218.1 recombinase family protein [Paenibacillus sp. MZ04-78.2]
MTSKPIKVAIYARVSTEDQAKHGYSIKAQRKVLSDYCKLYGKEIYDVYEDSGVSGKSTEGRYELQRLLKDAENKRFDMVLVWKINRLARKTYDLLHILNQLKMYNVTFRSFTENFETETSMGNFALQMMGAVSELERNTIVDNVKMGMRHRAEKGEHNGKLPLGYRVVPDPGDPSGRSKVIVVEAEAIIVRKIFKLYAAGRGLKSIANELNHSGYTTKTGNTFSTSAVKEILNNPFYNGKIRYNRYENWSDMRRRGKNATPIIVDGKHEAIIHDALWEKVQFLHQKKSFTPSRIFDGEFLLSGLIRCPKCGAAMVASRTQSKTKTGEIVNRLYYSCGAFRSKGSSVCSANSIRKQEAEDEVMNRLTRVLSKDRILKAIVDKINHRLTTRTVPLQAELEHIKSQLEQAESRKRRYLDAFEQNKLDKSTVAERMQEIQADLIKFRAERSRLELELTEGNTSPIAFEQVRELIHGFNQVLTTAPFEQRKTLMHLFIKRITVNTSKKIETIELSFDENMDSYFFPSPVAATADYSQQKREKIEIVI